LNRYNVQRNQIKNITEATYTLTGDEANQTVTVNAAAGSALVLPDATGSGDVFKVILGTTVSSNTTTIKAASASDVFVGYATLLQDAANTVAAFETAGTTDTITFNGTTTGGIAGAKVELQDIGSGAWQVELTSAATGTEATPFSATVS